MLFSPSPTANGPQWDSGSFASLTHSVLTVSTAVLSLEACLSQRNNDGGTSDAVVEGQGEFSSHETPHPHNEEVGTPDLGAGWQRGCPVSFITFVRKGVSLQWFQQRSQNQIPLVCFESCAQTCTNHCGHWERSDWRCPGHMPTLDYTD